MKVLRRIKQAYQIVNAWYRLIVGKSAYYEIHRRSVCSMCDTNVKGICSKELGGCGCVLKAKIKCRTCKCPKNYW